MNFDHSRSMMSLSTVYGTPASSNAAVSRESASVRAGSVMPT